MRPYVTVKECADIASEVQAMTANGDEEAAHATTYTLYRRVLREIADGHPYPQSIAATALQVNA